MIEKRNDFGVYRENKDLIYLDYAATTFMPDIVINRWVQYQHEIGVTYHRGDGVLSDKAQLIYDLSQKEILSFFDANDDYDILLGKNATECLNMLVHANAHIVLPGDIILMGPYEHHSNMIPWSEFAKKKGACLVQLPLLENGSIDYKFIDKIDMKKVRVISVSATSNINSYTIDFEWLKKVIENTNSFSILDVSQLVGHQKISFQNIGADAYVMSAHKMYGPKNIGAAIVKKEKINNMRPFLLGGGMVWNSLGAQPQWHTDYRKFEAGTYDIGLFAAWATACKYITEIGWKDIEESDKEIYLTAKDRMYGSKYKYEIVPGGRSHSSIISFSLGDIHPHDIGRLASNSNFEIRTGHMCAQLALNHLGATSLCRLSWGIGSAKSDVISFFDMLEGVV